MILENITKLLKDRTIAELEREVGFGNGTIRRWEDSSPSIDKVQKLAEYFNVSIDFLLTGKDSVKGSVHVGGSIESGGLAQGVNTGTVYLKDQEKIIESTIKGGSSVHSELRMSNWYDLSDEEKSEIRLRINKLSEYVDEIPEDAKIPPEKKVEINKYLADFADKNLLDRKSKKEILKDCTVKVAIKFFLKDMIASLRNPETSTVFAFIKWVKDVADDLIKHLDS